MFSFRVGYLPAFALLVFVFLKWSQSCGDGVWSSDHCDVKIYQDCFPLQSVDLESHTCPELIHTMIGWWFGTARAQEPSRGVSI